MNIFWGLISILIGYFLGSVPFGFLIGKKVRGIDIREHGSGNVGATNVTRLLGKEWGIAVFFLDALKGFLAAQIGLRLGGPMCGLAGGVAAIAGHMFPVWLEFKGGKGIATGFGLSMALMPVTGLVGIATWAVVTFLSGYVSLGSIVAVIVALLFALFYEKYFVYKLLLFIFVAFIIYKHRSNIQRILDHTESRINRKKFFDI